MGQVAKVSTSSKGSISLENATLKPPANSSITLLAFLPILKLLSFFYLSPHTPTHLLPSFLLPVFPFLSLSLFI